EGIRFFSATYRLFKLPGLEPACEDYGQQVVYKGTIAHHPERFELDKHHAIPAGEPFAVCGNTFDMLRESRFAEHFEFFGDKSIHHGIFPGCGISIPYETDSAGAAGGCC
ncbi:MAG: methyltransferase type 11, partial [Gammaproteobacteria bacterium]|nr:methyltransferase type 11 [Gammaproteobacteria bacterium]